MVGKLHEILKIYSCNFPVRNKKGSVACRAFFIFTDHYRVYSNVAMKLNSSFTVAGVT